MPMLSRLLENTVPSEPVGDLVPLSTLARAITGTTESVRIRMDGQVVDCASALKRLDLQPLPLRQKEGLALVNGTSFSSAIAVNCLTEARNLMALTLARARHDFAGIRSPNGAV